MKVLSAKLKGVVQIKIKNEATGEIIDIEKIISKVLVMPTSYGTYYGFASKSEDKTAIDAIVISLDFLTEILTIYNGQLIRSACQNIKNASLYVLSNKISQALQQQTGTILNPQSILMNIRNNIDQINVGGKIFDIGKVKQHYIQQISKEIVSDLKDLLGALPLEAQIDYFIISGEAVDIFWTEVEMLILEEMLIEELDRIVVVEDKKFSHAIGFEMMAQKRDESEVK